MAEFLDRRLFLQASLLTAGALSSWPRLLFADTPGRSIVRDAGWLLTSVVRVQSRGHLIADAGMTELLRPMLYGARHPVTVLAPGGPLPAEVRAWTLSGPICEAGDVLARELEEASGEGALLAIGEAGAYGAAMASSYNGRLRPAHAVIEDGELRLSRRRETLDDAIARDVADQGRVSRRRPG